MSSIYTEKFRFTTLDGSLRRALSPFLLVTKRFVLKLVGTRQINNN